MAARLTAYVVVGIVAATLIAGLIVGAQRDDTDGPVDVIVHNAKVYTAGPDGTMAEAVAIRGNQILRVGSEREIMRLRRPQTTMIDAKGAAVFPVSTMHTSISSPAGSASIASIWPARTRLTRSRRASGPGRPHTPTRRGCSDADGTSEPFTGGLPTRQQLDAIVPDRPAQIVSHDGHTSWVNTRALQLARRLRGRRRIQSAATIVRDSRTGEPTGVLKEAAVALVCGHVPQTTRAERAAGAPRRDRRSAAQWHHQRAERRRPGERLRDLRRRAARWRPRRACLFRAVGATDADRVGARPSSAHRETVSRRPALQGWRRKIMLDGVIETHTAAMLELPYGERRHRLRERRRSTPTISTAWCVCSTPRGWQVMTHASRRPCCQHGAHGLRARGAIESAARARPASPDRACRGRRRG